MNNIENEIEIIPKKLSFTSTIVENRSRATSIIDNLATDFETPLPPIVSTIINETDENNEDLPLFSTGKIYKNLFILSIAFVIIFTAYSGILSLQSSLNTKGNVGVNSLIVINVFMLVSAIFLPGMTIDIFGLKWTMIIGEIAYISYICANVLPTPALMYITAAFVGLAAAPLWISQGTYITIIARYYAHHKKKQVTNTVSLFFGIFFAIFSTSGIWGNLFSYAIINESNHTRNASCGVYFSPSSKGESDESGNVSNLTRYILCGLFCGMGIVSMICLVLFLDQIRLSEPQPIAQSFRKGFEVIQSLFRSKHIDQLLLAPITMWTTIEVSFLIAQFTRAFVTCVSGIRFVGLVMVFNGVCGAISSYIFGELAKYIGRFGCLLTAAILNFATLILMFFWNPLEEQMYVLFIIAGLWGIAGAVWQSQVIAAYAVLYSDSDPTAISKYRLWKAAGSVISYAYASYITIELTLIVLFSCLSVSMICYGIVEIRIRWKTNTKKTDAMINYH